MFPTSLFRLGVLVAALTVGVPVLAEMKRFCATTRKPAWAK